MKTRFLGADNTKNNICDTHIPDLLATGFFSRAKFARSGESRYRIQYEAQNQEALDGYLETDAARLRAGLFGRFPEGVALSRENWEVLQDWRND